MIPCQKTWLLHFYFNKTMGDIPKVIKKPNLTRHTDMFSYYITLFIKNYLHFTFMLGHSLLPWNPPDINKLLQDEKPSFGMQRWTSANIAIIFFLKVDHMKEKKQQQWCIKFFPKCKILQNVNKHSTHKCDQYRTYYRKTNQIHSLDLLHFKQWKISGFLWLELTKDLSENCREYNQIIPIVKVLREVVLNKVH